MERLIYSNSTIPSKLYLSHRFLPRLARVHSPKKLAPFPSRLTHLSCCLKVTNKPIDDCLDKSSYLYVDSTNGLDPNPHFLNRVAQKWSQYQKVVNAGTAILLSAIFLTVFHPSLVPPALASFPNVAKAGGPASTGLIRSELLVSAWTGFFAGCLHTLSGPDHLAALAPLSIGRTKMESLAVGALWGCGHDAGQVIFGLLFLLLKDRLHIEVIRTWGTRVVGFTLLMIGGMGIREASEASAAHSVALETGEFDVSGKETLTGPKKKIGFATFATGIVHGLQPDALMMILPALALPSRLAGAAFLVMFLVGTVIAMGSYTVFIGSCSEALKDRVPRITEKLTWVSSMIAIGLGLAILISQFFGFSLY